MKIQHILSLSLGFNVVLIGVGSYLLTEPTNPLEVQTDAKPASVPPKAVTVSVDEGVTAQPISASVEWRQVESEDFPTYIANLRRIGVPEPTVRDIVAGEMATQYQEKRQIIQEHPAPTEAAGREKQALLDQLPREQGALVANLLQTNNQLAESAGARRVAGSSSFQIQSSPVPVATDGSAAVTEASGPALLPAVLVPTVPSSLTEIQAVERQRLEDDFVEQIGGPDQDPLDPAYRARWQSAQEISDTMFRAKFGHQAFLQHNIEAGRRLGEQ
jgi:hypothetical protein